MTKPAPKMIEEWKNIKSYNFDYKIEVIQILDDDVKINKIVDKDFYDLSK